MHVISTIHRPTRTGRFRVILGTLTLTLSIAAFAIASRAPSEVSYGASGGSNRLFSSTGHSIGGAFLRFFDAYGGVSIFGYPISDPLVENGRSVQYFERQRFEYHSEAEGTSNVVQLGRLGADLAPAQAIATYSQPFDTRSNQVYFKESRHSLSGAFLDYWRANGGLRILGYPVTEPFNENSRLVQYFERARMEYHPEIASGARGVQLGLLGRQYLAAHANIAAHVPVTSRGAAAPALQQAPPSAQLSTGETTLLQLINIARQQQGMAPVELNGALRAMALARSQDMVTRNYFSHTTPDGATVFTMLKSANISYKYAGEIIANNNYTEGDTATQAYNGFMNSPHHHEIMLDPRYSIAGVGEATDGRGFHYFTVIFLQQ